MSDSYDVILIPYHDYEQIKQKIEEFHNANDVIVFANLGTMEIILSHFQIEQLKTQSKRKK